MLIDVGYWTRIVKRILVLVLSLLLLYLSFKLAVFYMPFLIGFIISLLIEPIIKRICKRTSLERRKVAIIVLILILGIIFGLISWGILTIVTEGTNLIKFFNDNLELIYNKVNSLIESIKEGHADIPAQIVSIIENSTDTIFNFTTEYVSKLLSKATQIISSLPIIGIYIIITILATYFICTDKLYIRDTIESQLPNRWARKLGAHVSDIIRELGHYLKAEIILILISFIIVLVGLYFFKIIGLNIQYPFLSALRNRLC